MQRACLRSKPLFVRTKCVASALERGRWGLTIWYNQSYTSGMKTAISIPDPVYEAAEQLAHELGMSRSELYATAISDFVSAHQEDHVTAQLDELYATQDSSLDQVSERLQTLSLSQEEW